MSNDNGKIRISFSGGGFRATFYCLGVFRRLVELDLWNKICRIDSVSGGSITAGAIMCALNEGDFKDIEDFDKRVTKPLKELGQCGFREWITVQLFLFLLFLQIPIYFIFNIFLKIHWLISLILVIELLLILFLTVIRNLFSIRFESLLDKFLFKKQLMHLLPTYPEWSANAACLNTGKRFRFKQKDFGGYKIGTTSDGYNIKVSFAVACSAAFPQAFAPYTLNLRSKKVRKFYDRYTDTVNNNPPKKVFLSDGGVYDNLGSENILKGKESFIVIDAGGYLAQWTPDLNPGMLKRSTRIIDTALDQVISLRRRLLFCESKEKNGIMLILGAYAKNYLISDKFGKLSNDTSSTLPDYNLFPEKIDELIADLRTDLDTFHDIEIEMLMWAGAVRVDMAVKRYFKNYLTENQFNNTPKKPNFSEERIKEILSKGKKVGFPLGIHYRKFKEV